MDDKSLNQDDELAILKQLTAQDFLDVGIDQVAYIKPIETDSKTAEHYSVHAADGSQLSIMDSYDTAVAAVRMNDLFPVTLH